MVKALVLAGYGINCDMETSYAFRKAGAESEIVHINDLISKKKNLAGYSILAFPGGFSYGDDTGSGNALANKIKANLWSELKEFIDSGKLVIGICNGFQVLANLGLVPALEKNYGEISTALTWNTFPRYQCRWVELKPQNANCIFTKNISLLRAPIAHGEGRFTAPKEVLEKIESKNLAVFKYARQGAEANGEFPFNPNGSDNDVAGICDETGRVFGMMPHPERNIFFTQQPDWTLQKEKLKRRGEKVPEESTGMQVFRNAVEFFK